MREGVKSKFKKSYKMTLIMPGCRGIKVTVPGH